MSDPAVIVEHVLEKGGILRVSGSDLVVDAPAGSLSPDTIEALRQNKPKILELVLGEGGCITPPNRAQQRNTHPDWTGTDWQAFFDERAEIAEHDGGLSRDDAETRAFECTVVVWLNRHPAPGNGPDQCAQCGGATTPGKALPFLNGHGHVWLHADCHAPWMEQRRADAVAALQETGIERF